MKNIPTRQLSGNLYALLSGVCVSAYFVTNRYVYTHFHPEASDYVSTFVVCGGALALLSQLLTRARDRLLHTHNLSKILFMSVTASFGIALTVLAQKYTTASNAAIIATFSVPITIYTSHLLLGQSIPKRKIPWILGFLGGVYLAIIGFNSYTPRSGDVIMIGSCLLLGLTNTLCKPLLSSTSPMDLRDYRFLTGGILFGLAIIVLPEVQFVTNAGLYPLVAAFFFWSSIFCYYKAVEQIGPAHAIMINNVHPAMTTVVGVLILSEPLMASKVLGVALVLLAIQRISESNRLRTKKH